MSCDVVADELFYKKHPSGKGGMRTDTKTRIHSHGK